jgi:CheY-like chemotaxis protein
VTSRIAVIDDEAPNRAYLQTLLGTAGFDVQVAAGGNEGVALVEKERPDLVLLDLMMPEVDGFMACERIRKGPAGADIQIVVLSAADGLDGKSGRSSWALTTTSSSPSSRASWSVASTRCSSAVRGSGNAGHWRAGVSVWSPAPRAGSERAPSR